MKASIQVAVVALAVVLGSVDAARGRGSPVSFTPKPKYVPGECLSHPKPLDDGPWDTASDYTSITTGVKADGFCGSFDICFAIDESGSMDAENFNREIALVRKTVATLVEKSHPDFPSNYSAWLFDGTSYGPADQISPSTADYASVLYHLQNSARYDGGCTNITAGLLNCRRELATNPQGQRVIVLISDGAQTVDSNNNKVFSSAEEDAHVLSVADDIKKEGTTIITVELFSKAVGQLPVLSEFLKKIASAEAKTEEPRFFAGQFETLLDGKLGEEISNSACDEEVIALPAFVRETCPCSDSTVEKGLVAVLSVPAEENNGVALCELRSPIRSGGDGTVLESNHEEEKFMCDYMSTDRVCIVQHSPSWHCIPGTIDGSSCQCRIEPSAKAVPL